MLTNSSETKVGFVNVMTSSNGGLSAEQWAELATNKIISIGTETEGPIRDQAIAYREQIKKVIELYIEQAIESHQRHLLTRR